MLGGSVVMSRGLPTMRWGFDSSCLHHQKETPFGVPWGQHGMSANFHQTKFLSEACYQQARQNCHLYFINYILLMQINYRKTVLLILFLISFLVQPAMILSADGEVTAQIIISEIAAHETSDNEWIEIYNNGSTSADLTGWKFFEEQANHGISVFQGTSTLNPAQYAVIANKADLVKQKYPNYAGAIFDSSWGSLKEEGEEIGLKNAAGNLIEVFTYPQTGTSTSLEKIDLNLAGSSTSNWANHPTSNSIGQARTDATTADAILTGTTTGAIEAATGETAIESGTTSAISIETGSSSPLGTSAQDVVSSTPQSAQPAGSSTAATNSPPQAVIQIQSGSLTAYERTTINFDGRASFDPNGNALIYIWDMGDGATETTANPSPHAYNRPGIYTVTLAVIDEFGAQGSAQQIVNVLNKPVLEAPAAAAPAASAPTAQTSAGAASSSSKQAPIVIVTQNSLPQPAKEAESKAPAQSQQLLLSQLKLPQTEFTLKGYFVFVPSGTITAAPKKTAKKSAASAKTKKPADAAGKSKPKKPAKTKVLYKNGDVSNAIKITEILPNPNSDEGDQEWIELFNSGTETINLGNWELADGGKKPFLISDSAALEPGAYKIFQKSETDLALNNNADSVFLYDFNGDLVDTVAYEKSQKGYSYALIGIKNSSDLVASAAGDFAPKSKQESAWEWISEPSPEAPNPSFEKVKGTVLRLLAESDAAGESALEITLSNGASKIINFDQEVLDPLVANVVMKQGASVNLRAQKRGDGSYYLNKIDEVRPAPVEEEKKDTAVFWIIIGAAALGVIALVFALNAPPILKVLKNYAGKR